MDELMGKRVAFVTANEGVEQSELTEPWQAVVDAGGEPVLLAPEKGKVQAFNHLDKGDEFEVDEMISEADPATFDAVVLPGGVANADQLRSDSDAIAFVKRMSGIGKPFGVICHGPWALVEADLLRDRTITSWPSLQTDVRNAGGTWVDEEVKVCANGPMVLVTSRKPDDLPAFNRSIIASFSGRDATVPDEIIAE